MSFSSFAAILLKKSELNALLLLSSLYILTVSVLRLFLTVLLVGLQCVIVVFSITSSMVRLEPDAIDQVGFSTTVPFSSSKHS